MDPRINRIKQLALDSLDNAKAFIQKQATEHHESALKEVLDEKVGNLPAYIRRNKMFSLSSAIAKDRMAGVNVVDNPDYVTRSLYDCTFDVSTYKAIGVNDGTLIMLNQLFLKLGMKKKAQEAISWTYNAD